MSDLTIGQALRKIKKLKGEIAECSARATSGVSFLKESPPAFRFVDQLEKIEAAQAQLIELETRVAIANATHKCLVPSTKKEITLVQAIKELHEIKAKIALFKSLSIRNETVKSFTKEWDQTKEEYSIVVPVLTVWTSDISEVDRDKQVKDLEKLFEELNDSLEFVNSRVAV